MYQLQSQMNPISRKNYLDSVGETVYGQENKKFGLETKNEINPLPPNTNLVLFLNSLFILRSRFQCSQAESDHL